MSDVRQKAKDLLKLAIHDGTPTKEREAATSQLLKLIDKYDLLSAGGKPINVAASILEKLASLDINDVASHAESFASGVERIFAAGKRVAAHGPSTETRERERESSTRRRRDRRE